MQKYQVAGLQIGTARNSGKPFKILHLLSPVQDVTKGVGSFTRQEFISEAVDLTGVQPGCWIEVEYSAGFDGKAYVESVHVVAAPKPAKIDDSNLPFK